MGGSIGRGHEDLLVGVVEGLVDGVDALGGDDLGDGAGDALHGVLERLLLAHAELWTETVPWTQGVIRGAGRPSRSDSEAFGGLEEAFEGLEEAFGEM
eukprot:8287979-Pyramimonas_sp.AAC.1